MTKLLEGGDPADPAAANDGNTDPGVVEEEPADAAEVADDGPVAVDAGMGEPGHGNANPAAAVPNPDDFFKVKPDYWDQIR
jgi:hypothetical protein